MYRLSGMGKGTGNRLGGVRVKTGATRFTGLRSQTETAMAVERD